MVSGRDKETATIRRSRPIAFVPLVLIDGRSTTLHSVRYSLRQPSGLSTPRKARRVSLARRLTGEPLSFRSSRSGQNRVFRFCVVPGTFTCRPSVTFLSASASVPSDDSPLLDSISSDSSPITNEPAGGTPLPPSAPYSMRKVPEVLISDLQTTVDTVKNRTQQSRASDPSPPRVSPSASSSSASASSAQRPASSASVSASAAAPKPSRPSQPKDSPVSESPPAPRIATPPPVAHTFLSVSPPPPSSSSSTTPPRTATPLPPTVPPPPLKDVLADEETVIQQPKEEITATEQQQQQQQQQQPQQTEEKGEGEGEEKEESAEAPAPETRKPEIKRIASDVLLQGLKERRVRAQRGSSVLLEALAASKKEASRSSTPPPPVSRAPSPRPAMSTNQIKSADGALDVRGTLDRVQRHRRTLQPSASHRNPSSSSSSSASASARPSSPTPANIRRSSKRSVRTILWEACQRMVVVLAAVVVLWGAVKLVVQPLSSAIFGSARQQQDTVAVMDDTDNELGGAAAGSRAAAQQPTSAFGRAMHGLTAFFRGDRDVMEVGADATTQTDSLERLSIGKEGEAAERAAASDARQQLLGHYRTAEAPLSDLVVLKEGRGKIVKLRSTAARHFSMMATAAKADGVDIIPLSGFRSIQDQVRVFFDLKARRVQQASERAKVSAPPGYSEHHTGYALDVGDARYPNTHLEISFETTPAYKWLQKNAARFHFELSFPPNNPQGIMYEPWHWRFVGDVHSLETFAPSKMT